MSDIQVGEYVRTKDGYIGKLISINKESWNYLEIDTQIEVRKDNLPITHLYLKDENIAKHSFNMKELLKVADFVKYRDGNLYIEYFVNVYGEYDEEKGIRLKVNDKYLEDIEILSVVTNEQMKMREYKI